MRVLVCILIALATVACSGGGGNTASLEQSSSELSPAQREGAEKPTRNPFLVTLAERSTGLVISCIELTDHPSQTVRSRTLAYPAGAEPPAQRTRTFKDTEVKYVACVNGQQVLCTFTSRAYEARIGKSWAVVLSLPGLEPVCEVMHWPELEISAVSSLGEGWVIGTAHGDLELNLALLLLEHGKLRKFPFWTSTTASIWFSIGKRIDCFARSDRQLIAIDDVVKPKYAILCDVTAPAHPLPRLVVPLPTGANERYVEADMHEDRLALLSIYGVQGSYGHRIRMFEGVVGGLADEETFTEYVPWDYDEDRKQRELDPVLLAGEFFTAWNDVVLKDGRIFIAAIGRGLQVLNLADKACALVHVEGACVDVLRFGNRVFALTIEGDGSTVSDVLADGDGFKLQPIAKMPVADQFGD